MRAYSWILVSGAVIACGGGAFTASPEGSTGSGGSGDTTGDGATSGVLGRAGRGVGGSLMGGGGKVAVGGTTSLSGSAAGGDDTGGSTTTGGVVGSGGIVGIGGDVSVGGDLVVGGSVSVAGQAGTGGSGGNPGPDTSCPQTQPAAGNACQGSLTCSYGTDVRPTCRAVATCKNNMWALSAVLCKPLVHCDPDMVPDAVCDPQVTPSSCVHDSVYCLCAACIGNSCAPKATWHCSVNSGDASCPKIAPNEGQACNTALKCQYGSCALQQAGNIGAVCDKTWTWDGQFCPN